ncbi:magnesium transporter [Ammoniphilus sp. YIM 78166]|uniref:magnesium transporter n=1 Tax=Ammoniphilus sp. YIM 78166 TaxID=1644106 RepID=UPI00106F6856|nr:magnesium transporter [Ammoniphilus sp. YIM 78166]
MTESQILLVVIKLMKELKKEDFKLIMEELQPYDIAHLYKNLPEKHRHKFLTFLSSKQVAILLQELDTDLQLQILHKLGVAKSSEVMDLMENDDLVDLLHELTIENSEEFLASMKKEESQTVKNLMQYPRDTAGGLMTNRFVWIRNYYTVREAVDKLKAFASMAENIYYLYVLNEEKKLVGVVSYRDLLLANLNDKVDNIMFTRVISVPVDADQEEVASLIERYDFIAVPVVDHEEHVVGIVTVDDVLDVIIQEANEDIEKLSASGKSIDFQTGAFVASFRRLPWLILLLFIGLISGSIISQFEDTLQQVVSLAFFMPMIAGMTGNTGTQSLAVVVRGLVSQDIDRRTVIKLVVREFGVGLIIGIVCSVLITIVAYVWRDDLVLGLVVGSSLLLTLIIGTLAGTVIPLLLYRFDIDPAVASGPLITTLNDIFSLFVYFGIASMFLAHITG